MIKSFGYAANNPFLGLHPHEFEREEPGADDVVIDILYCGVCHSDVHQVKNEWKNTVYPCLPGHEIVGRVLSTGAAVTKFKTGDLVGVGCMIDSCAECAACKEGLEQYCEGPNSWTATYNGPMKPNGSNTFGGYSTNIVVKEHFVLRVPETLDTKAVAPLLCAGITTYSPLKHWKVSAGQKVGIVGLGGLGHMAVQLAKAMGAHVTVFTTSKEKEADAKRLGAENVVISTDKKAMTEQESQLDFILSTIPEKHDVNPYVQCLKRDGTVVLVGVLAPMEPVNNMQVAFYRRNIAGSLIGGIAETQEVLDFCAEHNIVSDIELIPIEEINKAYKRIEKGDVKFRFVIDGASLKSEAAKA